MEGLMAPPMFNKQRQEGWMDNPEIAAKHQKMLDEMAKQFSPLPVKQDIRHLPEQERKVIELQDEVKRLQAKNAELVNELEDRDAMLELASTKYLRVKIDVKKLRGTLDFVNGSEFIWASINQNTNVLEGVSTKP